MAAKQRKWWLFGFAGIVAGLGYLIRPECAQLVVYGFVWLGLELSWPKVGTSRVRTLVAMVLLVTGFLVVAGPYMDFKGGIFPKKKVGLFAARQQCFQGSEQQELAYLNYAAATGVVPLKIVQGFGKLVERVGETLMWFFLPALLIGGYANYRKRDWHEAENFLVKAAVALNVPLMIWLYCKYGYMSRRHVLPLVVFTIFFIPSGLRAMAAWLQENLSERITLKTNSDFWFLVLAVLGICICIPKLFKPIRQDKQSYREAAEWLAENTGKEDVIAVPDGRISFYAERKGIKYDGLTLPEEAKYVVEIYKNKKDSQTPGQSQRLAKIFSTESKDKKEIVTIYERAR